MTDIEKILAKTQNGFDVFTHFFGDRCAKGVFRNVFRSDGQPSCKIYEKHGRYYLKDYGDGDWSGDCFHFIAMKEGWKLQQDFHRILEYIDRELELFVLTAKPDGFVPKTVEKPLASLSSSRRIVSFDPTFKAFTLHELAYWERYGITENVLRRYHVVSLLECLFTREDGTSFMIAGSYGYPLFGYCFPESNRVKGIKTYRPGTTYRFIYGGEVPRPYVFGLQQLPQTGECLFITGGEKDVMTLAAHGFNAICFNSESARVGIDTLRSFASRFKHIVILYDTDEPGLKDSQQFYDDIKAADPAFPIYRLLLPLSGDKKEKDVSDFFLLQHTAVDLYQLYKKTINENQK